MARRNSVLFAAALAGLVAPSVGLVHDGPRRVAVPSIASPSALQRSGVPSMPSPVAMALKPAQEAASEAMRLKGGSWLSSLKGALFPVEGWEMPKFFSMSLMMFMIIYIYTTVRDTKDTLVVSACGAESITFLKVYGVLPAATMFMVLYSKLSSIFSKDVLFYVTAVPFFIFYGLFAFVLYPNRDIIHPPMPPNIDERLKYSLSLLYNWSYSLFYIISELWGSVGVSVLFWQMANDITPVWQANRFYPLFGQLANIAPICAGQTVAYFARRSDSGDDAFGVALQGTTVLILAAGVCLFGLYANIQRLHAKDEASGRLGEKKESTKKKKPKMGMVDSFKFLVQQKYLGYLCVLVVSYGLSINLTEVIWKKMVKEAHPNKKEYQIFMGNYSSLVGAATFIIIFFGSNIVKHLGWRVGALTTPVLMGGLAAPFFAYVVTMGQDVKKNKAALWTAVHVGMWQNILSKAIKYALFDPTKEMAYIPLDQESKVKGKAAIDVLAARIGKSGGALVQQMIVIVFGNIMNGASMVAAIFFATIFFWIYGVLGLAQMFEEKVREGKAAEAAGKKDSKKDDKGKKK
jgi:ATP:ADP antiporter, AAA family